MRIGTSAQQPPTSSVQTITLSSLSLLNPQSSIINLQSSIFNLQSSIFNLQSSIFNLQSSIFNLQSSIFNLQSSIFYVKMFSILSTAAALAIVSITTTVATPIPNPQTQSGPGELCEATRVYYPKGMCATGFVGCGPPDADNMCHGTGVFDWKFNKDCGAEAFNLGKWFECPTSGNGYYGCNTILNICDLQINFDSGDKNNNNNNNGTPSPPPAPPADNTPPPPSTKWSCPPGTNYFGEGVCPSGFLGCHQFGGDVCPGAKRFYSDCPSGMNFFRCGNGFVGCSTKANMCG
jgi:hypothetical protein